MNVQNININKIKMYKNNPRINENSVEYVAESIDEFGFQQPIVLDKNNVIIVGHTRYLAAKYLNLIEVPCIIAEDLTPQQIKAYRLVDNKTNEFSEWDFELLSKELEELEPNFNMDEFGFDLELQEIAKDKSFKNKEIDINDLTKNFENECPKCGFEW